MHTIFLDRDGIINDVVVRDSGVSSPRTLDEFILRQDFHACYKGLLSGRFRLFVVSNQPDVSRNLLSVSTLEQMSEVIRQAFAIEEIRYCTHDDAHQCHCRKPKPGMLLDLMHKHRIAPAAATIIGDSWKDIEAGKGAGVRTILLSTHYNAKCPVPPDLTVDSLAALKEEDIRPG